MRKLTKLVLGATYLLLLVLPAIAYSSEGQNNPSVSPAQGDVRMSAIYTGSDIDSSLTITNPATAIPSSAQKIHSVFHYDGNAKGRNFQVKWFSRTHNCLVTEDTYLPRVNGRNLIHAFLENGGNPWPEGDYRTEIWFDDHRLDTVAFSIGKHKPPPVAEKQTPSENGKLLGTTHADGTGDNRTKKKGGTYLAVDLKTLADEDHLGIRVTSGKLEYVNVHLRNTSGVWHQAYRGPDTRLKVADLLQGKRRQYTHLIINVNGHDERYLPNACNAEVRLNPPASPVPVARPKPPLPNTNPTPGERGAVKQIVMDNQNCGYDFSTGRTRDCHGKPEPDIMNEPWCTDGPALCGNWVTTGESRMQDVTSPPATGYLSDGKTYTDCHESPVNQVLVFKLKDGSYGKFMIIEDKQSKVDGRCQHKITSSVEYPAFATASSF